MACKIYSLSFTTSLVKSGMAFFTMRKFRSFRVVEFFVSPLTYLSTVLPFKSKTYLRLLLFLSLMVFSMMKKCTEPVCLVLTVNTPKILAISVDGFSLQYWMYYGIMGTKYLSSVDVMVLIMNIESWLKKKNEPLLPAPSPDLKIYSLLSLGLRLCLIVSMSGMYSLNAS